MAYMIITTTTLNLPHIIPHPLTGTLQLTLKEPSTLGSNRTRISERQCQGGSKGLSACSPIPGRSVRTTESGLSRSTNLMLRYTFDHIILYRSYQYGIRTNICHCAGPRGTIESKSLPRSEIAVAGTHGCTFCSPNRGAPRKEPVL